jgi:putative phosphoesterase
VSVTRVAVIADIHSNLQALEAVVARIEDLGVEDVLCAGDVVGYGARPNECCAIVERVSGLTVYGNHEIAALTGDIIWMNPHAAKAAVWTSKMLNQASLDFLSQLELEGRLRLDEKLLAMYHGSVDSAVQYVHEDQVDDSLLERAKCDILILGHTHVPYTRRLAKGLVVNPGSVGQPRDRDPRASFAVLDTNGPEAVIERVAYDTSATWKDIMDAGLPEFLAERLLMGR